jgi:hypothetical protein
MATKKATKTEAVVEDAPEEPKAKKLNDAGWRDPKSVYAPDDNSIDARMWRLEQDLERQGVR